MAYRFGGLHLRGKDRYTLCIYVHILHIYIYMNVYGYLGSTVCLARTGVGKLKRFPEILQSLSVVGQGATSGFNTASTSLQRA